MPSTVENASSETEKLRHSYFALHDKGVRVNEMGIEKSRGEETGMTDTRLCDVWGTRKREERIWPLNPQPSSNRDICKGDFPREIPCIILPCSRKFHQKNLKTLHLIELHFLWKIVLKSTKCVRLGVLGQNKISLFNPWFWLLLIMFMHDVYSNH